MGNNMIGRRAFIGSAIAAMSFHALPADSFLDLRPDRFYMWKWNRGRRSFVSWGSNGKDIVRRIMIDMAYEEEAHSLREHIDNVASENLSLAQFPTGFRLANGRVLYMPWNIVEGECELEIPVTGDWLLELRKRHKHDISEADDIDAIDLIKIFQNGR